MNRLFAYRMPEFVEVLRRNGSIDILYSTLKTNDLADVVMTALNIMKLEMPEIVERKVKCEQLSCKMRLKGNEALRNLLFKNALFCYNVALMLAPTNSESMILALSNRSALLLRVGAIDECVNDIERCLRMKCSDKIFRKLMARREKCAGMISTDKFMTREYTFAREYFKFDVKRNKDIPCASEDVDVVKENDSIKVIAARDIELGKVVAIEPAFVAVHAAENHFTSCHYCHKLSLNLIPCDGCCNVLFCNEDCMKRCLNEYHKIECQIINVLVDMSSTDKCNLSIVAALKIREMCDSWEVFNSHSLKIGKCGLKESSVSEIYDQENLKSMLNFNDDKHFTHGKIFNQCFIYAVIIKYLSDVPNYLPQNAEKRTEAQRALARIMLSLYVKFPFELDIQNCAFDLNTQNISTEPDPSIGLFSFASKLSHSCVPNLLSVGLGNKLALIAVQSIRKGTELTISFPGHWCEIAYQEKRSMRLFFGAELRCQCPVCIEGWCSFGESKPAQLSNNQRSCFRKYNSELSIFTSSGMPASGQQFVKICRALETFQDYGNTREFKTMFKDFRMRLTMFQNVSTKNVTL